MTAMVQLEAVRDALATIPGVATCAVGLEDVIGAADYPMIRLVPSRITPEKYASRTAETDIIFGAAIAESAGLPAVYAALLELEAQIREKIKPLGGIYIETYTDEDRISAYKLLVVRCKLPVS